MPFTLIHGEDIDVYPDLADQMYRDRGAQFVETLGWDLPVDERGRERDPYDAMNPLYLIHTDQEGRHLASTRLMPTVGPNMAADHFAHLTDGVAITSPAIWEVTRFFVADKGARRAAPALMWAGCRLALRSGVNFYVGIIGAHMARVFTACGWAPEIVGRGASPEGEICACLWEVTEEQCARLARRAGIDEDSEPLEIYRRSSAMALAA